MSHHRSSPAWSSGTASTRETLQVYIERACDPSLHEPNLSLDLEIAELVNSKKANTPREAAVETIRLVNHRNTHVAMLALHLLDILVKNCGYPFHLQISTKEFLNELVRRFPERPPQFPPPPMSKILELIHEWKNTLCVHSKHKEDLVHIRDMHRLLSYKGYRFPDFDKRANSVLNPTENLQTPDELEEEDRAAQAAKLQELIRRGSPKDLAAAQELMKIMSGAEPEKRPDYEQQVEKELDRIQQRILLLNEMLNNAKPKERFVEGDAYDQIAQKCRHVQPKIQKWIADSAENDPGSMDKLLLMNDLINNVVNRYEAFKRGDRSATAEIDPAFATKESTSKAKKQAEQVSLIDFDFDEVAPAAASTASGSNSTVKANPMDDLSELASLSLGNNFSQPQQQPQQQQRVDPMSLFGLNNSGFTPSLPNHSNGNSSRNTTNFSSPSPNANNSLQTANSGAGTFFSNPAYGQSSSQSNSRSSTPSQPGAISLGSGSTSGLRSTSSPMNSTAWGTSPPLPQLPYSSQPATTFSATNAPAPPPKKKDAFEDLLGDF